MEYEAPCGSMLLGALSGKLCLCDWLGRADSEAVYRRLRTRLGAVIEYGPSDMTKHAAYMLDRYFDGGIRVLDVPLLFAGTDFQKDVWSRLLSIPYGAVITYSELARSVGRPEAVRAVANAVGANAMSIFVPCHRVIGRDGSLTGYAGGLAAKSSLLALESSCRHNNTAAPAP